MDNLVKEGERQYVVVIVILDKLDTVKNEKVSFLKKLYPKNDFLFTLKLLLTSDLIAFLTEMHGQFTGYVILIQ